MDCEPDFYYDYKIAFQKSILNIISEWGPYSEKTSNEFEIDGYFYFYVYDDQNNILYLQKGMPGKKDKIKQLKKDIAETFKTNFAIIKQY